MSQAVQTRRVAGCRGSHILSTIGSQMAVRFSALRTGHPLPAERFLVLISVRGWVDPGAILRLEELGQLKNPMASLGIEPATFQLVAHCLNQLPYRVPTEIQYCLIIWNFKQENKRIGKNACCMNGWKYIPKYTIKLKQIKRTLKEQW
jgi:hypothetical protein